MAKIEEQNLRLLSIESTRCFCGLWHARFLVALFLCLYIFSLPSLSLSAPKKTDLRILIDVSGSMKENDPQNLRTPSLRLLIGLIPNGTKAGIWTFGKYVNMQVKLGVVNKRWKKQAMNEALKIHSRGLYTNIEDALKKSSFDWRVKDAKSNRHIILLTDGVVDVSKDPEINLKSRNKIINYYLPKLKKAGVKIHTIALSQQADHELLKLLSISTDGWYELIEDPKKLHRVFLRLFEKSTSANALPLENNIFKVDKSIKDMTVLSFNAKETKIKLITPGKKIITEKNNPDFVTWFHETDYDLITINKPEAGSWKLDAPVDKDNRVLVVTNLTLSMNDIPNNVLLNQRIFLKAALKQKGKNIRNQNFLKLITVKAIKKAPNETDLSINLVDDGKKQDEKAGDGIYHNVIFSSLRAGIFELVVSAEGPTFQRQRQYLVNVFNGLAEIDINNGKDNMPFLIEVKPHKGLLQDGSIDIAYELDNGNTHTLNKNKDERWVFELPVAESGKKLTFIVKGLRQNNKNVEMQMERILPQQIKKIEKVKISEKLPETIDHDSKKTEEVKNKTKDQEDESLSVIIWVVGINVIVLLIALIAYFLIKRIRKKTAIADKESLQL